MSNKRKGHLKEKIFPRIKHTGMSHKRKGNLTVSREWKKHLRKFLKREFWKKERKAGKRIIRKESNA